MPRLPAFEGGSVWLVGAGPGDPGLLTATAIHGLMSADVIVYDALVSDEVLSLAADTASLEYAGKRGGVQSPKQNDITNRLIELAHGGRRVLRLKGGDPFVFGRGAEEAMALADAGVPFRVVPGITSGIGGLATALLPVTSRDTNHAVTLMTGHLAEGGCGAIDWRPFVETQAPLILYMAMSNLAEICVRLEQAGMPSDMPVAVVANASRPDQRVLESTLRNVAEDAKAAGLAAPAIVAVGRIVSLRAALTGVAPLTVAA
ncbi:MAG: uroporphyrinogen-III C-methyltransferase [Leifsonia xyli]|nr:MAG: uroporphyrinogen-III C-methyltransferase [Leifsonia xyli]